MTKWISIAVVLVSLGAFAHAASAQETETQEIQRDVSVWAGGGLTWIVVLFSLGGFLAIVASPLSLNRRGESIRRPHRG